MKRIQISKQTKTDMIGLSIMTVLISLVVIMRYILWLY